MYVVMSVLLDLALDQTVVWVLNAVEHETKFVEHETKFHLLDQEVSTLPQRLLLHLSRTFLLEIDHHYHSLTWL